MQCKSIASVMGVLFIVNPVVFVQAEESTSVIEEVVVTARYKEESVQDSPVAVTAFSALMLEKMTAQDLRDVGPATPNVHIQPVVTFPNSAAIHIRGMGGQNIESTNEMRTGVSINGVFMSRPIASLIDFFDVESVEVHRGPQGTTFGKNSLAGGISIATKKPDGTFEYATELTAGNEGRLDFRGAVQFPIIEDVLSGRITALLQNYDGHFKNRVNGKNLSGEDIDSVRATLVWTPTSDFKATLIGTWMEERSDAPGGDDDSDPGQLITFLFAGAPFNWTGEPDDGAFTVGRDALEFHNTDQNSATLLLDWDIGNFTIASVFGWVETDGFIASDFDQTELPFFPTFRDQVHDQTSFEVRLHSNFSDSDGLMGKLEFVVGYFYFEQEHEMVQSFPTLGPSADYAHQDGESRAIFGQIIYAFSDDLNLTLGVRRSDEKKDFERNSGTFLPSISAADPNSVPSISEMARLPTPLGGKLDSDNTSVKIGLDYHFNENLMGFVSFSQGFKAGEFGARADSEFTIGPTDDEESDSYEIGIRSDLMDGRLRLNATLFNTTFENLQFGVFFPSNNITGQETANQNIGESTNRGVELEITAVPIDGLTLQGSFGYLDAEYDKFCADLDGPGPAVNPTSSCGGQVTLLPGGDYLVDEDHTSQVLSRAPERQIYFSAEYRWNTNFGGLFIRAAGNYESEFFTSNNHPKSLTGAYTLWDASLGWTSPDDRWRIQAWCKNCGDKLYTSGLTPTAQFFNQHFWGVPRMYGVTLGFRN